MVKSLAHEITGCLEFFLYPDDSLEDVLRHESVGRGPDFLHPRTEILFDVATNLIKLLFRQFHCFTHTHTPYRL